MAAGLGARAGRGSAGSAGGGRHTVAPLVALPRRVSVEHVAA